MQVNCVSVMESRDSNEWNCLHNSVVQAHGINYGFKGKFWFWFMMDVFSISKMINVKVN